MLSAEEAKRILKADYKKVKSEASTISNKNWNENRARVKEKNTVCPICKSKNVNDRIEQINGKGKISGSFSSSHSLFSGSGYGSISGSSSIDTDPVNKCNDCNHEWKKYEGDYDSTSEVIENWLYKFYRYSNELSDGKKDFIYTDSLDCKYDSREQADEAYSAYIQERLRYCRSTPLVNNYPEVLIALAEKEYGEDNYQTKGIKALSIDDWRIIGNPIMDEYLGSPFAIRPAMRSNKEVKRFFKKHSSTMIIVGVCLMIMAFFTRFIWM